MTHATALLLNWERPENLHRIIESLRAQSVPIEIFLWNNNPEDKTRYDVDLQIDASKNLMCWPRWWMANYASSEYIFSLDDDLMFSDPDVVKDCVEFSKENDCAIGGFGMRLRNRHYQKGQRVMPRPDRDISVDILMGRFVLLKKNGLDKLAMRPTIDATSNCPRIEDDIVLSSCLPKRMVPALLHRRLINLHEGNSALCHSEDHYPFRERYARAYFGGRS